jgi:hypothetical protein
MRTRAIVRVLPGERALTGEYDRQEHCFTYYGEGDEFECGIDRARRLYDRGIVDIVREW